MDIWQDGVRLKPTIQVAGDPAAATCTDYVYLGAGWLSSATWQPLTGYVSEALLFPAYHTVSQQLKVWAYLGNKYGIDCGVPRIGVAR